MAHGSGSALKQAAQAFRPRILAERDSIEMGRRLPEELARDLDQAGFFRISLPQVYGSLDLDPLEAMEVFEELARVCRSGLVWDRA